MATSATRADSAAALRNLGNRFLEHDVDPDLLKRIRQVADELAAAVTSTPRLLRTTENLRSEIPDTPPPDGAEMDHYQGCPVSGKENPLGLAARLCRDGGDVVARVTFDSGCEGMPGYSHGGPVAAVFDDVMGFVLSTMNGLSGYTATMTVSYRAPVRIGWEVEFRGRLARRDGRKLYIEATAHEEDGVLLADATGLFIEVPIDSIAKASAQ
jgi:acyl-coenzyme A thioesterase PaaI-like protein